MEHDHWPALELREWEPTYLTVHRWVQIVGKVALALGTPLNHWWHASLRLTPHGLTTRDLPLGPTTLSIALDFAHDQRRPAPLARPPAG